MNELLNPDELLNPAAGTPPALLLRRLIGSYRITHAIKAAAQLGIADQLGERPQSAGELAARLHVNPQALFALADAGAGLLADAGDGLFNLRRRRVPARDPPRDARMALCGRRY